jgi:hypothetical protein
MTRTKPDAALQLRERDVVEQLRRRVENAKAQQPLRPTLQQVSVITEGICGGEELSVTAGRIGLTDVEAAERLVLDVAATFGTWLAHSLGRADVQHVYTPADQQPTLFQVSCEPGTVMIPLGYEPTGKHRRDVDKALCAILHHRPSNEVVARFVARTYTTRQSLLSYPVVAGVWGFAHRGRLGTIDLVGGDLVFKTQVLEAYDLLDVTRQDAVDAVQQLLGSREVAPEQALAACDRAYWLDESAFGFLRNAANCGNGLDREMQSLRGKVQRVPGKYFPQEIADLTLGQVRRICEIAGIRVEPENRAEATEIRMALKSMGFSVDADRLVPEALRCAEQGMLDEFWDVMQARADGDPEWSERLEELATRMA